MASRLSLVWLVVASMGLGAGEAHAQCGAGVAIAMTCGQVGTSSCCVEDVARWCASPDGPLCQQDCAAASKICSWSNLSAAFGCQWSATTPPAGVDGACCQPACDGQPCGAADGCGGVCAGPDATCEGDKICAVDGVCCVRHCEGKVCGDDGCGGTCGECGCGEACVESACSFVMCEGRDCGPDGCGGTCGECLEGRVCAGGLSCCGPDCEGKACGGDGCGGSCGLCGCGERCVQGACVFEGCAGKACGDDGCGGSCGTCAPEAFCDDEGACVTGWFCDPDYQGGDDGCDCDCGAYDPDCDDPTANLYNCPDEAFSCDATGHCSDVCIPACADHVCGDDGCGGECGACPAGQNCHKGACVTGWFCDPDYQGGDDGCDCDCGAYDPDCDDPEANVYGCESWQTCDAHGLCTPEECQLQCTMENGHAKECGDDGCGGECGACEPGLHCTEEGLCEAGWHCNPSYQGGNDGCDCDCGAYDPDCDDPEANVYNCEDWQSCDAQGLCTPEECPRECTLEGGQAKQCGSDGCGDTCGTCPLDAPTCEDGLCVPHPCGSITSVGCCTGDVLRYCSYGTLTAVDCAAAVPGNTCGWSVSDWSEAYMCGSVAGAPEGTTFDPAGDLSGVHPLTCPDCQGRCWDKPCGAPDGCGSICGCPEGLLCEAGECHGCTPLCYALACGDDGCGGACGACAGSEACFLGQCCAPQCAGKACGHDGCGGACGSCGAGSTCVDHQCCTPTCDGSSCGGGDGCGGTCGCSTGACVDGVCVSGCGDITYEGCCEGTVVRWCDGDEISEHDCAADVYGDGPYCDWDDYSGYYWCGYGEGEDPSGAFPRACGDGPCTPSCAGKACDADDGCGHPCGCPAGQECQAGQCVGCQPDCLGRTCGDDGCGGSCGACMDGEVCHEYGVCVDACMGVPEPGCCEGTTLKWCSETGAHEIDCAQASATCGWTGSAYGCGDSEDEDPIGALPRTCEPFAVPNCAGRECGDDGIGGSCGACPEDHTCSEQGRCQAPDPCAGKECGPNGMGGVCGTCASDELCEDGQCVTPVCDPLCTLPGGAAKECGDDGCGGTCGTCAAGETCADGVCTGGSEPEPDVVTPDTAGPDTAAPDTAGTVDRDEGGGGGCAATGSATPTAPLLLGLLLALVTRRRLDAR